MSAINQHPSRIDRASNLRTDAAAIEELWQSAQIIHCVDGKLASHDGALKLMHASDLTGAFAADFTEGSRYFLGKDLATGFAYFAWDSDWKH